MRTETKFVAEAVHAVHAYGLMPDHRSVPTFTERPGDGRS